MAGFISERVAGFRSECLAGFVGIRMIATASWLGGREPEHTDGFIERIVSLHASIEKVTGV
jgi:hypothetical protein